MTKLNTAIVTRSDGPKLVRLAAKVNGSELLGVGVFVGGVCGFIASLTGGFGAASAGHHLLAGLLLGGAACITIVALLTALAAHRGTGSLSYLDMASACTSYEVPYGVNGGELWRKLCQKAEHVVRLEPRRATAVRNLLFQAGTLLRDAVKVDDVRRRALASADDDTAKVCAARLKTALEAVAAAEGQLDAMISAAVYEVPCLDLADRSEALVASTAALRELDALQR